MLTDNRTIILFDIESTLKRMAFFLVHKSLKGFDDCTKPHQIWDYIMYLM